MASRGNKVLAGQIPSGKPPIAPNLARPDKGAAIPGKPQGSSAELLGVVAGASLQSAEVAKVSPGCGVSSAADKIPDLTATDGARSGIVSGKPRGLAGVVPDKAAGATPGSNSLSPGAGARSGKEQTGGVSGRSRGVEQGVLGRGGIGRAGSSACIQSDDLLNPGGLAGQSQGPGLNPDNPHASSGGPRVAAGSSGLDVAGKNRSFWEAKNARIRNRERGVGIKHFPTLLGARKITISLDQWNKGVEKLDNALVGIVFGEKPNLGRMRGYARARWQDRVKVAMLNDGIFLFKFTTKELRCDVLYGGPLTFDNKPLIFQRWDPDVSYKVSSVKSIPVWVRLPGLRAHFHEDEDLLGMVCSVIGKPLKTDGYTGDGDLMTFARVCVEIYSDQEYPDRVIITDPFDNDYVQEIKYEWLPKRCVNCCSFGHLKEECDMPSLETVVSEEESDERNEASKEGSEEDEDHCDIEAFLVEDKDIPEDLEEVIVGSAGKSPEVSRGFLDDPTEFPELPRKVQECPEENTEESESEEGEVLPDTQDLPPAPSLPVIKKKPKGKGIVIEESSKKSRVLRSSKASSGRRRGRGNKR